MKILFFSSDIDIVDEWVAKYNIQDYISCSDVDCLLETIQNLNSYIIVVDYDSIAHDLNKLISKDNLPNNLIVLEKVPAIVTGKMLISHNIKAYGNSRMLSLHFSQMISSVKDGKIWTYPELTIALANIAKKEIISNDAVELINTRLSAKEIEVIYFVLDGLTNEAISHKLGITLRTAKAHISSIFSKLHINDRVSLILLLK